MPFAGWEMPVTYEGIREEHAAVRTHAGMFDVSHMGEVEVEGPGALAFLQRVLSNDVATIELGGAQYSCLCNEERRRPRRPLHLPARRRPLPDRHQLRQPRGRPRLARALEPRLRRRRPRRRRPLRDARRAGPARPRDRRRARSASSCRRGCGSATVRVGGRPALVCGTGYTGEDGVELLIDPEVAPAIWAELLDAGVVPCGLGARDTLRLEVCFHLHGNDLSPERNPIEAGLGWCCKEATGFVGSEAVAAARAEGPAEKLAPFKIEGAGIPRQGNPVLAGGEQAGVVTCGTFSPSLEIGIGMAYVRADLAEPGTEIEIDVRGKRRAARIASKPLYEPRQKEMTLADASYPDDLLYHAEHDWARLEGDDTPTFGITWYAQDSLGEVVFYDPPEVGATIAKDASYAEVESVKAVSDVIAPLSGEIVEVNDALGDAPGEDQRGPLRRGLAGQGQADRPERGRGAARRRRIPQAARKRLAKPRPRLP